MTNLLVIKSSASGAASVSSAIVDEVVAGFAGASVVQRDVGAAPLPPLSPGVLAGLGRIPPEGQSESEAHAARKLSDTVIAELKAADVVVIGAPMYNFGIPATLKGWIDYIARAGETFQYTPTGPKGMVEGKTVIVVEARGGAYFNGPMASFDNQEPHLKAVLGFLGMTDIRFIRAEQLARGPEAREAGIAEARAAIRLASAA